MRDKNDDGHCQPERQDEYGQKGLWSKKGYNNFLWWWKCNFFFSILRLTQIIWEIERGDEFCSLPIDVKKSFAYCFGNLGLHYVLTSTKAHHRLLDAILSRFLQMEPVLSIKQTICSMMKRQFPTNVVYIQPLCSWFKCEIGMTNVATMTTAMIRIWKKQKCIIDLSSRRCCCSHWQNFP